MTEPQRVGRGKFLEGPEENLPAAMFPIAELVCDANREDGCSLPPTHALYDYGSRDGLYCEEHARKWVEFQTGGGDRWKKQIESAE